MVEAITGIRPYFTTAEQAAQHLGTSLDQHDLLLLVVDDVWTDEQARYLLYGSQRCGQLITASLDHS